MATIHLPPDFKDFLQLLNSHQVEMFLEEKQVIRMGVPPLKIDITTSISGVGFAECFAERIVEAFDGIPVNVISQKHLKANKKASGRLKDLADLQNLP